jgi:hypothetical protein
MAMLVAAHALVSCAPETPPAPLGVRRPEVLADYLTLLGRFPEPAMGVGPDTLLAPDATADHLEVYALLLSSEARRWAATRDPEAARRLRACWNHLMDHRDADGDGKPGWGMPLAWDAFGDGTVNPADTPYTISTAQVIEGLFDAMDLAGPLFSGSEVLQAESTIRDVWSRWSSEAWTQDGTRGWFWYSPVVSDSENVVNVNAMMLGVAARALRHGWREGDAAFSSAVRVTAEVLVRTILGQLELRSGLPHWPYIAIPNRYGADGPNDAVHHAYVIWGLERARDLGLAQGALPYPREDALASVGAFLRGGKAYELRQDVTYAGDYASFQERPMILWGLGASLAFLGEFGSTSNPVLQEELYILADVYGPIPGLRLWPASFIPDDRFYPRHAVHVLWGLAAIAFGPAIR